jgi:predicted aconitase with swiveling domain
MIVKDVETVLIVSAFIARVPLVDRLEKDPLEAVHTGDILKVDAEKSRVTITRPGSIHS